MGLLPSSAAGSVVSDPSFAVPPDRSATLGPGAQRRMAIQYRIKDCDVPQPSASPVLIVVRTTEGARLLQLTPPQLEGKSWSAYFAARACRPS